MDEEMALEKVEKEVFDYIMGHLGCTTDEIIKNIDASPERINKALQNLSEKGEIEQAIITEE